MNALAQVTIHASQFPENVRRDLLRSLRSRKIAHKFHYDSVKQTQKWLALHQQFSPSRHDADCRAIYGKSFEAVAQKIKSKAVHLIGLGCGGGQKDTRLLKMLKAAGKEVFYTPSDVATAMVLTARQAALSAVPAKNCFPLVCDLETTDDLRAVFDSPLIRHASRIITFFGMIPNSEPEVILPKLASLIRRKDFLLFSANLAPGKDYAAEVKKILPQYNNTPTRDWLLTFLFDLGIGKNDGALRFEIETKGDLKRIVANFHLKRACRVQIENNTFAFKHGEKIRLFFSYRYTPERVQKALAAHHLEAHEQWLAKSGEEGVFLCCKR
ncbi:MAG TPA: L-histidine N(alpha)-methyltransferase [Candidatus Acidoferrales bacterium]|jgi:L-histidine N-alpha-methyltransferase|nr:L-histidine N(alpha)-methyltransferase [Candidatus Acidoferrales bacterium]